MSLIIDQEPQSEEWRRRALAAESVVTELVAIRLLRNSTDRQLHSTLTYEETRRLNRREPEAWERAVKLCELISRYR